MADAISAAMVGHAIAYVYPPASFERSGQLVRGPSEILERRVGTCLDLALTYASCLEQAGLHPVLVLTEGHALVGVWLTDTDFSTVVVDDPQMLRKRIQLDGADPGRVDLHDRQSAGRFKQAIAARAHPGRRRARREVRDRDRCQARPSPPNPTARSRRQRPTSAGARRRRKEPISGLRLRRLRRGHHAAATGPHRHSGPAGSLEGAPPRPVAEEPPPELQGGQDRHRHCLCRPRRP